MQVAFSAGTKSEGIINSLKKTADNIEFFSYNTIQDMIKDSKLRHISFKRIVFTVSILKDIRGDLLELNDFIKNDSSSSEIVMIVNKSTNKGEDQVFVDIFNSPMYTPVLLGKATPTILLEIVRNDIMELKAKYYVVNERESKAVVLGSNQEGRSKESNENPSILGGFFGSKKQTDPQIGNSSTNSEMLEHTMNGRSIVQNINNKETDGNIFEDTSNSMNYEWNNKNSENGRDIDSNISDSVPSSVGSSENDCNNFDYESEEDLLSIGDFGSQHSDTGYLDEDGIDELEEFAKSQIVEEKSAPIPEGNVHVNEDKGKTPSAKISILSGCNSLGVTQLVVDKASALVSKGYRVLIVDCDYISNGLLSYIDTDAFYGGNYQNGIVKKRVYVEDNIGVVSNGYGYRVSGEDLYSLLTSYNVSEYDYILIDCPIDCISILSLDVLNLCSFTIVTSGERSGMVYTSLALTNRDYISVFVERYIMSKCLVKVVNKTEYTQEDLEYMKNTCVFPNGSWLDKIV